MMCNARDVCRKTIKLNMSRYELLPKNLTSSSLLKKKKNRKKCPAEYYAIVNCPYTWIFRKLVFILCKLDSNLNCALYVFKKCLVSQNLPNQINMVYDGRASSEKPVVNFQRHFRCASGEFLRQSGETTTVPTRENDFVFNLNFSVLRNKFQFYPRWTSCPTGTVSSRGLCWISSTVGDPRSARPDRRSDPNERLCQSIRARRRNTSPRCPATGFGSCAVRPPTWDCCATPPSSCRGCPTMRNRNSWVKI